MAGKSKLFWWVAISVALLVLGAFGPWARVFVVNLSGTEGDGWLVIACAVLAGVMLYQHEKRGDARWPMAVSALAGVIAFVIVTADAVDIYGGGSGEKNEFLGDADVATPGWGLIMDHIASASLVVASLVMLARGRTARPDTAETPAGPP